MNPDGQGTSGRAVDGEASAFVAELFAMDREHVWHPLTQHQVYQDGGSPLIITDGEGCFVSDIEGHRFFDAAAGLWCVNVGYGRQELVTAAMEQMTRLAYYPLTQSHINAIQLSVKLGQYLPDNPILYYSNSGSEANETAFKIVRQYWRQKGFPRKTKILSRHRAYHGSTMGALSATGQLERTRDYEPLVPGFIHVSAPYCYRCPFQLAYPSCRLQCAEDFARRIEIEGPETVAAIIVEPITAGGGVLVPPGDYLSRIEEIARRYEVLLIADEVVTGFGRTGAMFAHRAFGVKVDIVTMAKGLASGYMPIGATAVSREIFNAFLGNSEDQSHLRHVNTFSGHPVACAVAIQNLMLIEREKLVENSVEMGGYLLERLQSELSGIDVVGDVRGKGLLVGVELVGSFTEKTPLVDETMRKIARELTREGILAGKTTDVSVGSNNILIFAPPLIVREHEIDFLCDRVRDVLRAIKAW